MKICVIGTGYVGLVTGSCLADLGNEVICVDKNKQIINKLEKSVIPFFEPGLKEIVLRNHKNKHLTFTNDAQRSIERSDVIFIAVDTPPKNNGEADISSVVAVAKQIAKTLKSDDNFHKKYKVIVNKSTVPVGMGDIVTKILLEQGIPEETFTVVSNPEFLREGTAISDFMSPDRIVIGASNSRAYDVITELYRPLNAHIIFTSVKSAELIKYASNSFLATKISFINEIANICEKVGSDVAEVAYGMGLDKRIGKSFLNAGIGYGGSCLPKDISALTYLAKTAGYDPQILVAVNNTNNLQRKIIVKEIVKAMGSLKGKKICVLGLSFKPETDDLRNAPSLEIIKDLIKKGAKINAYDPVSETKAKKILPKGVILCSSAYAALTNADAAVIASEWNEFKELNFDKVKEAMKRPIIFDGRNIYDPKRMKEDGFEYHGIGR